MKGEVSATLLAKTLHLIQPNTHELFNAFSVYRELEVDDKNYLMNIVSHRSFARKMELRDYFLPLKRGTWNDFSHMANIATVNAYYNQV